MTSGHASFLLFAFNAIHVCTLFEMANGMKVLRPTESKEASSSHNTAESLAHIGLSGQPWLPMSMEIEFFSADPAVTKALAISILNNSDSAAATLLLHLPDTMQKVLDDLAGQLGGIVKSQATEAAMSAKVELNTVLLKHSHDEALSQHVWLFERENARGMLELSSPIDLLENEADFVVGVWSNQKFTSLFSTGESFHVHVDARCLLQEERRTLGLILIWERFYDAVASLTQVKRPGVKSYAAKLADKNPELLQHLQNQWTNPRDNPEPLKHIFKRFENQTTFGQTVGWPLAPSTERDGYRNCGMNVCHLLEVDCCQNCSKNLVPKFGGIEFRLFDASFDRERNRHYLALVQRLVQSSCSANLDSIDDLISSPQTSTVANDASKLLKFLQLDVLEFQSRFQ